MTTGAVFAAAAWVVAAACLVATGRLFDALRWERWKAAGAERRLADLETAVNALTRRLEHEDEEEDEWNYR